MQSANSTASSAALERTWRGYALRLVSQRNFALWLDYFVPLFSGITLTFAVIILAMRTLGGPDHVALFALPVLIALIMGGIWLYLRKRFERTIDGLVQLDINCRLHNRLTAADAGVGPWPKVPNRLDLNAHWRWERILPPVICSIGFLWAAQAIKVTTHNPFRAKPTQPPMAWTQANTWLDTLKEEELVEEKALDEFAAKMESLQKEDAQEWYSHGSLEAGDRIKDNLEKGMLDLQQYMKQTQELLESSRASEGKMSEATLQKVEEQYAEAMKGLENGALPMDQKMMEQLKSADPKGLSQMSKEQYEKMMERMQKGQQTLGECLGNNPGEDGMGGLKKGMASQMKKQRHTVEGGEEGEDGDGSPGKGGVSRGRGDAPLSFEDEESYVGAGKEESLSSEDFSRALPGDMVGMSMTTPEVDDKELQGVQSGGQLMSTGKGGEAVWRDTLTPEEREFLGKINQ